MLLGYEGGLRELQHGVGGSLSLPIWAAEAVGDWAGCGFSSTLTFACGPEPTESLGTL